MWRFVPFDATKQGKNGRVPGKTGVFWGICLTVSPNSATGKMLLYGREVGNSIVIVTRYNRSLTGQLSRKGELIKVG